MHRTQPYYSHFMSVLNSRSRKGEVGSVIRHVMHSVLLTRTVCAFFILWFVSLVSCVVCYLFIYLKRLSFRTSFAHSTRAPPFFSINWFIFMNLIASFLNFRILVLHNSLFFYVNFSNSACDWFPLFDVIFTYNSFAFFTPLVFPHNIFWCNFPMLTFHM